MSNYLLGLDIGTSSLKAAVFDKGGHVIASGKSEYKTYYPHKDFVEQNPNEWWEAACTAIKDCLVKANISNKDIKAVGIDGQSWSAVPIDKSGNVLHNTPIWMDTRAKDICKCIEENIGQDAILKTSGNPFKPMYSTPKIIWFKENMPDIYKNTAYFLQSNSYLAYKLTGNVSQDKSQGYGLHFYDISNGKYDENLADVLGIDLNKLPAIFECDDVIGDVTEEAAKECGLAAGTPVVAGGLDAACGTLGAGVYNKGKTQEQGGQAGGMSICLDEPCAHRKLILSNHVVKGKWLLQGGTVGGGGTLNWYAREFGMPEKKLAEKENINEFQVMSREAGEIALGANGLVFLPYMSGERSPIWDENAKGIFFGLSYDKTRKHMIRAIMEGVAFSLLHNVLTAEEAGAYISEFNAMGGAANSEVWTQMKSDVTGKPINVAKSDTATTWGAAMLAGVGTGLFKDYDEAVGESVMITRRHEPNMVNNQEYKRYYEIYLELYEKLKDTMNKLSI